MILIWDPDIFVTKIIFISIVCPNLITVKLMAVTLMICLPVKTHLIQKTLQKCIHNLENILKYLEYTNFFGTYTQYFNYFFFFKITDQKVLKEKQSEEQNSFTYIFFYYTNNPQLHKLSFTAYSRCCFLHILCRLTLSDILGFRWGCGFLCCFR